MTPIARKAAIIVAVVALLVIAYLLSISHAHRTFVNTAGRALFLSDSDPTGKAHIWTIGVDGSNPVQLTKGNETDSDPTFSPDGSQIAFVSDRTGTPQIWRMNADGTQLEALTIGNDAKSSPRFSPDGNTIAFISRGALTTLDVDSHAQSILLPVPKQQAAGTESNAPAPDPVQSFAWCPVAGKDSTLIAAVQESEDGQDHVAIVPSTGTQDTPAVDVVRGTNISVTWTPDGTKVLASILGLSGLKPPANMTAQLPPTQIFLDPPKDFPPSAIYSFDTAGNFVQTAPLAASQSPTIGPQNTVSAPDSSMLVFELWGQANIEASNTLGLASVTPAGTPGEIRFNGPLGDPQFSSDGSILGFTAPVKGHIGMRDLITVSFVTKHITFVTKGKQDVIAYMLSPAKTASK